MHLHTKAEDLANHIREVIQESTDESQKQALEDVLPHVEYIATRLKEIGSA